MENLYTFLLFAVVTLFFVQRYMRRLSGPRKGVSQLPAVAGTALAGHSYCPRCSRAMAGPSTFCPSCGAALAMWKIHRAQVRSVRATKSNEPVRPRIDASLCVGCGACVDVCPEEGALELVAGKAILAQPERCTGQAKCSDVCPTQAIALACGDILQTVKVPNVNDEFETNVPGAYIVGELGGMGLIKTAINEGKMVIDVIRRKLQLGTTSTAPGGSYDVLIIGAGPAGLSATLTAHQYELNYVALEQEEIASTIRHYPRQKFLMAEPVEIPLYGTLYVGDGTKEHLLAVWETIVSHTGVKVRTSERVAEVQRKDYGFVVKSTKAEYHARFVVLALGKRGTPRRLSVPGEEQAKVAYRLIEADTYEDKDVLIVGGGDSAIEAALALSRSERNRVTLCHQGDEFKRMRERNRQMLGEAERRGRVRILRSSRVLSIQEDSVTLEVKGEPKQIANDFVFVLIGGEPPEAFLHKAGIEILERALSADAVQPEFG